MRFTPTPRRLRDFAAMNRHQQTSPDSHFTHGPLRSLATADGRVSLTGGELVLSRGGERLRRPVGSARERRQVLRAYFAIEPGPLEPDAPVPESTP